MQEAIHEVINNGKAVNSMAAKYGIPQSTLYRRIYSGDTEHNCKLKLIFVIKFIILKLSFNNHFCLFGPGFHKAFSCEQEKALVDIILKFETNMCGLTALEVRGIAYEYAEKLRVSHPFSHAGKLAGKEWYRLFRKRHGLSIRTAEHTSQARANAFKRENFKLFHKKLKKVMDEYQSFKYI